MKAYNKMAALLRSVVRLLNETISTVEATFSASFRGFQPQVAVCGEPCFDRSPSSGGTTIEDEFLQNGILWAVPKNRRTVEKRLKRKFGNPHYHLKLLVPRNDIRVCDHCGHCHEENVLCPNCYAKVKQETEAIQSSIQNSLGLSPVEKDVVVLYEGEREQHPSDYWKGKRIVEMNRPRPAWFSRNLLQKSVEKSPLPEVSDVKPTNLG
ncbi:39S ribosomal protein L32, mitochondrial [Ischnura elegans]|uniref:39S ribosomal protein L32, mitochondrial n=1 Tax=Ischnura elegans TaxID=197161 RepID=UPI001ED87896|nr:39S ribosomal protein L32, mitochondrial [Ischnura elegans]